MNLQVPQCRESHLQGMALAKARLVKASLLLRLLTVLRLNLKICNAALHPFPIIAKAQHGAFAQQAASSFFQRLQLFQCLACLMVRYQFHDAMSQGIPPCLEFAQFHCHMSPVAGAANAHGVIR